MFSFVFLLILLSQALQLGLLLRLQVFVLLNQIRVVLLHLFDFLLVLLVLNVFVAIQVVIEVEQLRECYPIGQLYSLEGVVVQCESVQRDGQDRWSTDQLDALLSIPLLGASLATILIVTLQHLGLDVVF